MPLPPEIITSAEVNSGLSDSAISSFMNSDIPRLWLSWRSTTSALPSFCAASKAVVLTVMTFFESLF